MKVYVWSATNEQSDEREVTTMEEFWQLVNDTRVSGYKPTKYGDEVTREISANGEASGNHYLVLSWVVVGVE